MFVEALIFIVLYISLMIFVIFLYKRWIKTLPNPWRPIPRAPDIENPCLAFIESDDKSILEQEVEERSEHNPDEILNFNDLCDIDFFPNTEEMKYLFDEKKINQKEKFTILIPQYVESSLPNAVSGLFTCEAEVHKEKEKNSKFDINIPYVWNTFFKPKKPNKKNEETMKPEVESVLINIKKSKTPIVSSTPERPIVPYLKYLALDKLLSGVTLIELNDDTTAGSSKIEGTKFDVLSLKVLAEKKLQEIVEFIQMNPVIESTVKFSELSFKFLAKYIDLNNNPIFEV